MLNIVGSGMRGPHFEQNLDDMDGDATGKMPLKYPGLIVGIKSAHFEGPEWKPYEQAVIAGNLAHIPVMIDYGANRKERPLYDLLSRVLRPGDIYTHMYSGLRGEQDATTGKASAAMTAGRKHGVYFDVGHGGGSFNWKVAVPLAQGGFLPDSISTDIHIGSMNAGMKDMLNVADKMIALGQSVQDVVSEMTVNPAHESSVNQRLLKFGSYCRSTDWKAVWIRGYEQSDVPQESQTLLRTNHPQQQGRVRQTVCCRPQVGASLWARPGFTIACAARSLSSHWLIFSETTLCIAQNKGGTL
jgi:predicted amidohydrolase